MPLATVHARALSGIQALPVTIEVDIVSGLPSFIIVGLAETAVKEARHRVFAAISNSQFEFPQRKIIVSLSPADLPKSGGRFDLAIAMGVLVASGQCSETCLLGYEFHAELALTGELRSAPGALPVACAASRDQRVVIMPAKDARQAAWAKQARCVAADSLAQVVAHVSGQSLLPLVRPSKRARSLLPSPDLRDVKGQQQARRALEIAASGGHGLLLQGPPGTGKTMLASRLPGLLPNLDETAALQVAMLQSLTSGGFNPAAWGCRPFRAPHHSASMVAMVGGGNPPRPGEISLAHGGVLFLDELPEFQRSVLEALRQPLEAGVITISRATTQVNFPANMQWVAAMNPCPCGYAGDEQGTCHCTAEQVQKYQQRLSGPLLDRIDLHVPVLQQSLEVMVSPNTSNESSATVKQRVLRARQYQQKRCAVLNADLNAAQVEKYCQISERDQRWLLKALDKQRLSARRYHRVLKVARTLADMSAHTGIGREDLQEALRFQPCLRPAMRHYFSRE